MTNDDAVKRGAEAGMAVRIALQEVCGEKVDIAIRAAVVVLSIDKHPKPKDVVGRRVIIAVHPTFIVFGRREGDVHSGAYITDYEEWFAYAAREKEGRND